MTATSLVLRITEEIKEMIRAGQIPVGSHLSAQKLADQIGVSRSPVREAMQLLVKQKILEQHENRGFFARSVSGAVLARPTEGAFELLVGSKEYQQLADDWLSDCIPGEVTEQYLRERYDLTKAQLTELLLRATREGWLERKQGYGWRFLPVAKTTEAFEQIYRFRMLVEPAAMLEPTFKIDRRVLTEQRRIQENMLASDIKKLPAERLLHNGSLFHEEIIKLSGNMFFHRALVQVNRMRRLLEYRARLDRQRLQVQCAQHLAILSALERGDVIEASHLMRSHLSGALAQKSPVVLPSKRQKRAAAA